MGGEEGCFRHAGTDGGEDGGGEAHDDGGGLVVCEIGGW